jgi:hypothetical protein
MLPTTVQTQQPRLTFVEAPVSPDDLREVVVLRLAQLLRKPVATFEVREQCGNVVYVKFAMVGSHDPIIPLPIIAMPRGFNEALRELVKRLEWLDERRLGAARFFEEAGEQVAIARRYLPHSRLTPEERRYVRRKLRLCVAYPNRFL